MREEGQAIEKDPSSIEPYGFDWTDWLAEIAEDETIATSTWAVTKGGEALTLTDASIVTGSKKTQVKLNGGAVGRDYLLTNHVITNYGNEDDRSVRVRVRQR